MEVWDVKEQNKVGNREYAVAMVELRRSSAASRHKDRHAEARKGYGKGGRSAAKVQARRGDW